MTDTTEEQHTDGPGPARVPDSPWRRFFTNQSRFDFIGRSRNWLIVSVVLLVICAAAIGVRGLNFSIDFTGGASFVANDITRDIDARELRTQIQELGIQDVTVQVVGGGENARVDVPALENLPVDDSDVAGLIAEETGVERTSIDTSVVGPRWGEQISEQMVKALVAFLVLVVLYITVRFEWRMAVAALATLLHDVAVTVGLYALVGFQFSPATVIALLTILGYSLYDTVVVFDRVTDETRALNMTANETYGEVANRSVNEVLLRSLSTSVTSLLPVGSLLFIGAQLLGADTLQDLALALFVGMAVGTYSSIFVATPLLVWLKEKEPRYAELHDKVIARRGGEAAAAVAAGKGKAGGGSTGKASAEKGGDGVPPPSKGSRKGGKE